MPGSEAVIPISRANRSGATDDDYSGVPGTLTFGAADTEKVITFWATDDTVDDDGEKVELSFGTLPGGITVTAGEAAEATVSITDDDAPDSVTVSFGAASYTVAEGSSRTVTVSLDDDPERTVVIPIEKANQGGASGSDYSGVPQSVTFNSGDTSRTFDISAVEDNLAESDERVKRSFGTLPSTATAGSRSEADRLHQRQDPGAGPADIAQCPLRGTPPTRWTKGQPWP